MAVEQLKLRNEPVALLLVDQRMPHMSGVEFLEQALKLSKRALLTAYTDTDTAIRAINSVKINHCLIEALGASGGAVVWHRGRLAG